VTAADRALRAPVLVAALTLGAALLRIALAATIPLADDEAYYWLWSRHLVWGYPDHPPAIAALIALATRLGGDGPLGIRAASLLLASALPIVVYAAGRDLFDRAAGARAAVIASLMPIAALGTALAFPDAPIAFFWGLSLWTGWRALREGRWWWIAAGVSAALALLTKLTGAFLFLGLAAALASGPWRRSLRDPGFYAGIAVAAALVAPFVLWNATHDWWTIRFTLERPPWIAPRSVPENLLLSGAGQLAYHGLAAIPLLAAVIATARRSGPAWRYLAWMSGPLFIAFLVSAVGARAKPHWPSPAYLSAAIVLGALWPEWRGRRRALGLVALAATGALTAALAAAVLLPGVVDVDSAFGRWDGVARAAAREARALTATGRDVFILADGYQDASQIAYHLREDIVVTPLRYAFTLWIPPESLIGRDAVYVETEGRWTRRLEQSCTEVMRGATLMVAPDRDATLYICTSFRGVGDVTR